MNPFEGTNGVSAIYIVISVAVLILLLIGMWKMYSKAGEPGWASIIPLYNLYVLFKITWAMESSFFYYLFQS